MESARFIWIKCRKILDCDISPFNRNSNSAWGSLDEGHLSMGRRGETPLQFQFQFQFQFDSVQFGGVAGGALRRNVAAKAMAMAMAKAKAKHFIKNFQAIKQNFVQHLPNCVISIWTKCKAAKGPRRWRWRWRLAELHREGGGGQRRGRGLGREDVDSWWESRALNNKSQFSPQIAVGQKRSSNILPERRQNGNGANKRTAGREVKGKVPQGNNNWIAVAFVPCLAWQEPKKWSRVATSKRTSRSAKTDRKSSVRAGRRRCNRNRGYPNQIAWNACGG